MPRHTKDDPRLARVRREKALDRAELRGPSTPRVSPAGVTSFPIKAEDPATRRMIDEFIGRRSA